MNLGTFLFTLMRGKLVGTDDQGNRYFVERKALKGCKARRWVAYNGQNEASRVPPEWHAWLHYTVDTPLKKRTESWIKPHQENLTGTPQAIFPLGHESQGGHRQKATGDYQAWSPK
jgi:NADH:ubiquinone oxidoreductase subunit